MHPVYPPPPGAPQKLCITIVSNFSWAVVPREIDDKGYAIILFSIKGGGGGNKVYYGLFENGE